MRLEFLARVRRTTLWTGAIAALTVATYGAPLHALAILLGVVWSLVNLRLIELLVVALTGPQRGGLRVLQRSAVAVGGMIALFAAGALLLSRLSPVWLLAGFSLPFAVLVLKAASSLVLESAIWKRLVASRWRAAGVVVVLVAGAWWAATAWSGSEATRGAGSARRATPLLASAESPAAPEPRAGETARHGEEEQGPQKFPNVITVLSRAFPDAPWARFLHEFEVVIFSILIAIILCVVAFVASRRPQMIPGPLQNGVEMVVEGLHDFVVGILGPRHGPRYVPFLGSLFIYILAMNLFGLIPFMDSPTSSLNVTVSLALVVFVFSQFIGFKELGFVGYFDHMMGTPRSLIGWILVPLMLPIHVMGELAKPISLSCRLFGNIFGEDMLLVAFATLGVTTLSFAHLPFGLPLQLPFMFLALLTSTLQALVFTVLSTIYFLLMLPHDEHAHEGEAQHAH